MAETNPSEILRMVHRILLVDWPNTGVPRALLEAGIFVFGFSPDGYSSAELTAERPTEADVKKILPPENDGENGFLVFRKLEEPPSNIDAVAIYRPPAEIPDIMTRIVFPLQARILWLQPPVTSADARHLAAARGLVFIDEVDIAEAARQLIAK